MSNVGLIMIGIAAAVALVSLLVFTFLRFRRSRQLSKVYNSFDVNFTTEDKLKVKKEDQDLQI